MKPQSAVVTTIYQLNNEVRKIKGGNVLISAVPCFHVQILPGVCVDFNLTFQPQHSAIKQLVLMIQILCAANHNWPCCQAAAVNVESSHAQQHNTRKPKSPE